MGRWSRFRDRFYEQVEAEAKRTEKRVNAELRRFSERVLEADGQANDACQQQCDLPDTTPQGNPGVSEVNETLPAQDVFVKSLLPKSNPLGLKPGLGFIINHKTFEDKELSERIGSELDVKRVKEVLGTFQLTTKTINDGTMSDVTKLMTEIEDLNFEAYSCLVLVIMSHGYERDILAAKDGNYSLYRDVLYPILRNSSLVGKTKMLFVQSCKGLTDLTLATDSKAFCEQPTKTPDEILQFHSCVEGYVSYRSPTDGSFFIQILCDKLTTLGDVKDIRDICIDVIGTVKAAIQNLQIPMLHTNLTKPFVFGHFKEDDVTAKEN